MAVSNLTIFQSDNVESCLGSKDPVVSEGLT